APAALVVAADGGLHRRDVVRELPTGEPSRRLTPCEALRAAVHRLRAPRVDGLPPITGGLMGYAAYGAATLLGGHPVPHHDEAPCPPIGFLLIDRAVVFDHWRQRLVLVTHVPAGRYDDGIQALEELADKLPGACGLPLMRAGEAGEAGAGAGDANMDDDPYRQIVSAFKEHILAGDIYQ